MRLCVLLQTGELPYQGRHLKVVQDARHMMQRVLEERRAEAMLVEALAGEELDIILSALGTCEQLGYTSPNVEKAKNIIKQLAEEKKVYYALCMCFPSNSSNNNFLLFRCWGFSTKSSVSQIWPSSRLILHGKRKSFFFCAYNYKR